MAEKKYYWVKLKPTFFQSKEIKKLRRIASGDTYVIIYLKMQLLSLENGGKLFYDGVEDDFAEELALTLDEDTDNVKMTIAFLTKYGLLEQVSADEYFLPEVPKNTGKEGSSAQRMRKKRALQCTDQSSQCDETKSLCDNDVQKRYTEKEKDIDIELEKERELEKSADCTNKFVPPQTAPADVPKTKRFIKPTLEEVHAYCTERRNNVDAQHFIDYYESNGWKVGKNAMKDWKAAVRTWERNGYGNGSGGNKNAGNDTDSADRVYDEHGGYWENGHYFY